MKPTRLLHLVHHRSGDGAGLVGAGFEDAVDLRRVRQQTAHFLGHRLQLGHRQIGQNLS